MCKARHRLRSRSPRDPARSCSHFQGRQVSASWVFSGPFPAAIRPPALGFLSTSGSALSPPPAALALFTSSAVFDMDGPVFRCLFFLRFLLRFSWVLLLHPPLFPLPHALRQPLLFPVIFGLCLFRRADIRPFRPVSMLASYRSFASPTGP